jgi:hypothetical protein
MPAPGELRFRAAEQGDAQAIAALHTDSWQRHYRIAYSDAFLDDEAPGFLLDLWTRRLAAPDPRQAQGPAVHLARPGQTTQRSAVTRCDDQCDHPDLGAEGAQPLVEAVRAGQALVPVVVRPVEEPLAAGPPLWQRE